MRLINIVGVYPGQVDYMVAEAKRLCQEVGINETMLCMTLHRQGGERLEKVMLHKQIFREYRERLQGTGIKVGVLLQSLLGHRNDAVMEPGWQVAENSTGKPVIRGCILSQTFRDYIYDVVRLIAEEHPAALMIDDDCRQISGGGVECFCAEHMRRFNQISKHPFTAAELQAHLKAHGPQDETVLLFEKLRMNSLVDFASLVRRAIDSVDPDIPCACCTPGAEFMSIDRVAKAVAGKNRPMVRLCNANYGEGDAKDFPRVIYWTFALRNLLEGDIDVIDEADTYPQHRYSKAAVALHAKLTAAALNGEIGAKLWLTNLGTPDPYTQRKYDEILIRHRNYYSAIETLIQGAQATGPITPLPTKEAVFKQFHPLTPYPFNAFYVVDWQRDHLAHYGVPACYQRIGQSGIQLVTGDMLRFFDDAEIANLLSQRILLDDTAARILVTRGFGDDIGVTFGTHPEAVTEARHCTSGTLLPFGFHREIYPMHPVAGSKVVAELIRSPYIKAPDDMLAHVGAAACCWDNARGGRVAIVREPDARALWGLWHPKRRALLIEMLELLNGGPLEVIVECDQNVMARSWILVDGSTLLAVFNLNFDPLEPFVLRTAKPLESVKILGECGTWQPVEWISDGTVSQVKYRLETYGVAILKLKSLEK